MIVVEAALIAMAKAVAFLDNGTKDLEVSVNFDDSVIEDTNATIDRNIKLVQGGLRSKLTAIMEIEKCDEATARKELERIAEDRQITGRDIDWTRSDDEQERDDNGKIGFRTDEEEADEPSGKPADGGGD